MKKLEVGSAFFYVERCYRGQLKTGYTKVSKVGRKYFELEAYPKVKFDLETCKGVTEYAPNISLYSSEQEYLETHERHEIAQRIIRSGLTTLRKLSLTTLRSIAAELKLEGYTDN